MLHVRYRFGPDDEGKEENGDGSSVFCQEYGRLTIEAQAHRLQNTANAGKGADAAPEFSQQKPAEDNADPPDSPGQKEGEVAGMVLGTEKAHEYENRKGNIAKGAEIEKVAAMLVESLDPGKKRKEIDTRLFVEDKQNLDDLFDALKKRHVHPL